MNNAPKTVGQIYPEKWLNARHLKGQAVIVTISRAYTDQLWNHQKRVKEWKIILDFGRSRDLILNPTQARQMETLTGTDRFEEWGGLRVMLTAVPSGPGKETIRISKPPEETSGQE